MDLNEPLFTLDQDSSTTSAPDHSAPVVSAADERREFAGWLGGMEAAGRLFVRKASAGRCPDCRATVLTGLDADLAADQVTVDPTPLDLRAWEACRLIGRKLYTLRNDGTRWTINDLDPWAWPGSKRADTILVPEHSCGARFPGRLPNFTKRHEADPDARPPF